MGFPIICSEVLVPNIVVQTVWILSCLSNVVVSVLTYIGLAETESPEPEVYVNRASRNRYTASLLIRELLAVEKLPEDRGRGDVPEGCAVCLCEYESGDEIRRLRNCRHIFHRRCLDLWIDGGQDTCPLCRSPLVPRGLQAEFDKRLRAAASDVSHDFSSNDYITAISRLRFATYSF